MFEARQGAGKSTLVRTLAGDDWFTDQIADFGSKDASMQLRGVWMVELSELDALNRSDIARVKAFLTQQNERLRLPYGQRLTLVERQCVFAGTTNSDAWLRDETGGRRFWPVRCGQIDIAAIKSDRDQMWAEALHDYRAGVSWWLDDESLRRDAEEEQRGRLIEDPWQTKIEEFIGNASDNVSVPGILGRLGIEMGKQDQTAANRVARCLRAAGCERYKKRLNTNERAEKQKDYEWLYRKTKVRT